MRGVQAVLRVILTMKLPPLGRGVDLARLLFSPQAACNGILYDGDLASLLRRTLASPLFCSRARPSAPGFGTAMPGIRLAF